MSRFFEPISIDELAEKIYNSHNGKSKNNVFNHVKYVYENINKDIKHLSTKIEEDLSKVEFDCENMSFSKANDSWGIDLVGFHRFDNGLTYLGVEAGGDWETPIFFIIYWDGKNLRGYIPEDGNYYNKAAKSAYGNADDDNEDCMKRYNLDYEDNLDMMVPDCDKITQDIKARILPRK